MGQEPRDLINDRAGKGQKHKDHDPRLQIFKKGQSLSEESKVQEVQKKGSDRTRNRTSENRSQNGAELAKQLKISANQCIFSRNRMELKENDEEIKNRTGTVNQWAKIFLQNNPIPIPENKIVRIDFLAPKKYFF